MPRAADEVASAASNYEVLARLATGGMAEIYLARGNSVAGVERYVVLKRILREKASDTSFVQMFLDEARLAAQLQHPNVAQVYDIGRLGDSYFFTMEYVHGETLRGILRQATAIAKPIPLGCVLAIASGVAAGLHHAHTRHGIDGKPLGIVHRDVSPSNIMASFEGTVKLVDFGVAKATHRSAETRSGAVKGKISYLSPEQCRGNDVDRRSDLFSLGIVLWETISGTRLYRRTSDFDAMHAIVSDDAPRLTNFRPDVPPELDDLVHKLLAKMPAARYQTGDELHEDIDRIAVRAGVSMSVSGMSKFLRELFGQRPEPWVELQRPGPYTVGHTLTAMAVELPAAVGLDPVERALAHVIDLAAGGLVERTASPSGSAAGAQAPTVGGRPGSGMPSTVANGAAFPTVKIDSTVYGLGMTGQLTVPIEQIASAAGVVEGRGLAPAGSGAEGRRGSIDSPRYAPVTSGGPAVTQPLLSAIGAAVYPSAAGLVDSQRHPISASPPFNAAYTGSTLGIRNRRRAFTIIMVAFATVGVGIGAFVALRGGGRKARAPVDSAIVAIAPAPAPRPPPDAAVVARVELNLDAAVTEPVGSAAGDPSVAHAGSAKPVDVVHPRPHPTPRPSPPAADPSADLASAMQNNRFADAIALCRADANLVATQAGTCVLAACRTHDSGRAHKWLALVRRHRNAVITACRAAGTTLDSRPATTGSDACADPFACQE